MSIFCGKQAYKEFPLFPITLVFLGCHIMLRLAGPMPSKRMLQLMKNYSAFSVKQDFTISECSWCPMEEAKVRGFTCHR